MIKSFMYVWLYDWIWYLLYFELDSALVALVVLVDMGCKVHLNTL